jgi:Domain of unknown function (DUF3576)
MKKIILSATLLVLASCSSDNINRNYPEDPAIVRKSRAGKFFKDDLTVYGGKKDQKKSADKTSEENKNPLWSASVEVISNLLPISTIDSKSGIILTEWYQDDKNKNERIKINLLIKDNQIKDENLSLSLFKQKKDSSGNWQDEASDNNLAIKLIKEKILDKAKALVQK